MRRNFRRQLRALAASLFVALAAFVYLSLPRAAAQTNASPPASTSQAASSNSHAAVGGALTPEERRGKQIYLRGTSASGREIMAYLGEASL
ncbi:MAG TPA: hypothetical protein VGB76_13515, partial [Pyrinomonadaceae bacterium]